MNHSNPGHLQYCLWRIAQHAVVMHLAEAQQGLPGTVHPACMYSE